MAQSPGGRGDNVLRAVRSSKNLHAFSACFWTLGWLSVEIQLSCHTALHYPARTLSALRSILNESQPCRQIHSHQSSVITLIQLSYEKAEEECSI